MRRVARRKSPRPLGAKRTDGKTRIAAKLKCGPVTPTVDDIAFEAPDEFDDIPSGTDLTFEITIDDVVLTKVAKLVEP